MLSKLLAYYMTAWIQAGIILIVMLALVASSPIVPVRL
jgi:hypothetical protein